MKRLAIITTHPIQYYAPVFKLLTERGNIGIKVFYTWGDNSMAKHDPGFGKNVTWDIPLLDGYEYEWVKNTSAEPGSHHSKGIINPDLIERIDNYQPLAILVFGWNYNSHLKAIRHFKNKLPVYFRGDSTLLDDTGWLKSILKLLYLKWVYKHVGHAFYVGTNNRAYFKKYGLKDNQLSFAPHAIDNERFSVPHQHEANTMRHELGVGEHDVLILFAGKLEEKKSPQLLLKAFLSVNAAHTHLLFVGSGRLKEDLVSEAHGNTNVHFRDFKNQSVMPVVYQACDIFCLPSKGPGETWGLAVNEAMACGKAVLVSNKCGCAADLVSKNNGAIFSSENINELTASLKELFHSKDRLKKMGEASALLIKSWSFAHIAGAIEHKLLNE
ncbi:glycosyltransferase family 4 protein [Mucilaginibacter mali]|uniref:Glycosyltransferase family 4 protein n=1 Tax=Mucilaginibacter mali TaxID=2740462 RepID=A0A7D4QKF2_9SPHI|nr:glycosyltransferase family 4 protein [Mucilaginibacter mali]QKJ30450.1 glycosyltransferase family 4 protein [Mucilaginibacter mali]